MIAERPFRLFSGLGGKSRFFFFEVLNESLFKLEGDQYVTFSMVFPRLTFLFDEILVVQKGDSYTLAKVKTEVGKYLKERFAPDLKKKRCKPS